MKDCPDLASMSYDEKVKFWAQTDPRTLRRLGDRLLAESLPDHKSHEAREQLSANIHAKRMAAGFSLPALAKQLGVSESLLSAWEEDRVKAPDSVLLIIDRIRALEISMT